MKRLIFFLFTLFLFNFTQIIFAQISIDSITFSYTQDFNTLANTGTSSVTPTGWYFFESGTNADTTYAAGTGSSNTGNTYSFGATGSSERCFGTLLSGSLVPIIGASFTNNTGTEINMVPIKYTGEQWKLGTNTVGRAADTLRFEYSLDATSLSTGTWTAVPNLSFASPVTSGTVGALDGNNAANRTTISYTISGLSIANGVTFWIRWVDVNIANADDGLGVDDFIFNELQATLPITLQSFTSHSVGNTVQLRWKTSNEVNNYGFEIYRDASKVGFVEGKHKASTYTYQDNNLSPGVHTYQLKQVDFNGNFQYFDLNPDVIIEFPKQFMVSQNYPNPFNPSTKIQYNIPFNTLVLIRVFDMVGREVFSTTEQKTAGYHEFIFNGEKFSSGIYFCEFRVKERVIIKKMLLIK